jgi:hypothetical protein
MLGSWRKIGRLLSGTEAMRDAGRLMLPQHPNETHGSYNNRLNTAVLFNVAELTLGEWVGRPFGDPVVLKEAPKSIEALQEDIDLQGNNLHTFLRHVFEDGLAKGFTHAMVDFPRVPADQPRSLDDDRRDNLRPYWVHIKPENLFFAYSMNDNGREYLSHVRILETVCVQHGFAEVEEPQIRVLDLMPEGVQVSLYRLDPKKKSGKKRWIPYGEAFTMEGIDEIPIATFYADRQGFMEAKPPLLDLVNLNIKHWQSSADQEHSLTAARFPILAASGVPPKPTIKTEDAEAESITIGPYNILRVKNPEAKFYYVEHTGAALAAGEIAIEKIEARMAEYGAQFMKKKPGNQTATARALDSAEATSPLQDSTLRFISFAEQLLYFTAKWLKEEKYGSIIIPTDFGPDEFTSEDMNALISSRKNRDLSRQTLLTELKRRAVLGDDFDEKQNEADLQEETDKLLADATETNLDPMQEDKPAIPPKEKSDEPPAK